jgi:hypothetical protein
MHVALLLAALATDAQDAPAPYRQLSREESIVCEDNCR